MHAQSHACMSFAAYDLWVSNATSRSAMHASEAHAVEHVFCLPKKKNNAEHLLHVVLCMLKLGRKADAGSQLPSCAAQHTLQFHWHV